MRPPKNWPFERLFLFFGRRRGIIVQMASFSVASCCMPKVPEVRTIKEDFARNQRRTRRRRTKKFLTTSTCLQGLGDVPFGTLRGEISAEISPLSVPKGTSPSPCRQVLVVKNFFVRRRRVLRWLRAKSSLIVLTSGTLGMQHEATEKLAI